MPPAETQSGRGLAPLCLLALGICLALTACVAPAPPPSAKSAKSLVWPAPPELARIAYVQSVQRPADLGVKVSSLVRFGRWLTASDKGNEALSKPFGLALDENDNLCLTDTGVKAVGYFDRTRKKWQRWDRVGAVRFSSPVGIAKRNGLFYVADSALGSVVVFDEAGQLCRQISDHLQRPVGLAIVNQDLFVADSQRHCIVVFDLQGQFRSEFGVRGTGPGQFSFPTHLAVDGEGNLLVTDSMNSRIQVLDTQGHFKSELGSAGDSLGHFRRPKGVAVDAFGHIYALDALFDNIQIFDGAGRLLLNVGVTGSGPGEFYMPNGIVISRQNEIYITDSYNHRLQILKYVGPA